MGKYVFIQTSHRYLVQILFTSAIAAFRISIDNTGGILVAIFWYVSTYQIYNHTQVWTPGRIFYMYVQVFRALRTLCCGLLLVAMCIYTSYMFSIDASYKSGRAFICAATATSVKFVIITTDGRRGADDAAVLSPVCARRAKQRQRTS